MIWSLELIITKSYEKNVQKFSPTSMQMNLHRLTDMKPELSERLSIKWSLWFSYGYPPICNTEHHLKLALKKSQSIFLETRGRVLDLFGPCYGQGAVVAPLGLCWGWRTWSVVPSLPPRVRRSETFAAILQVALMLYLPPHGGVPVVLDGIIRPVGEQLTQYLDFFFFYKSLTRNIYILPSRKELGDLCPAVAEPFVGLIDDSVLFLSPRRLLDFWVEVIVPSFTTLLPNPSLEVLSNDWPTLGAVLLYQVDDLCEHQGIIVTTSREEGEKAANIFFECFHLKCQKMCDVISEGSVYLWRCQVVEGWRLHAWLSKGIIIHLRSAL